MTQNNLRSKQLEQKNQINSKIFWTLRLGLSFGFRHSNFVIQNDVWLSIIYPRKVAEI